MEGPFDSGGFKVRKTDSMKYEVVLGVQGSRVVPCWSFPSKTKVS